MKLTQYLNTVSGPEDCLDCRYNESKGARVRRATAADRLALAPLVTQTWLRSSHKCGNGYGMDMGTYCRTIHDACSHAIWSRELLYIELEGEVVSWLLHDGDLLLYAYTKRDFRGAGFCRRIADSVGAPFGAYVFRGSRRRPWLAEPDRYSPFALLNYARW